MISDLISNKKLNQIVTELFIRGKNLLQNHILFSEWYYSCIRLSFTFYASGYPLHFRSNL